MDDGRLLTGNVGVRRDDRERDMNLAIAAVTQALGALLQGAIEDLPGEGLVSTSPPHRGLRSGAEKIVLHAFLYRIAPAPRPQGQASSAAPGLAVDLCYLLAPDSLTPFGNEAILASSMAALHAAPLIPRSVVEELLPQGGLAPETEMLRISQEDLPITDLSALWQAMGAPFRLAVAYRVKGLVLGPLAQRAAAPGVTMRPPSDPFRIDLGAVVSKYVAETEKNLSRIFDATEQGPPLFEDEADDLFGRKDD